jgi:hypothetical protein
MTAFTIERTRKAVAAATSIDYVTELVLAPARLREAERQVASCKEHLDAATSRLKDEEDRLLIEGHVNGSNKETREARLRSETGALRMEVARIESILEEKRINQRFEANRFSAMRAIVRYLAREGDEA